MNKFIFFLLSIFVLGLTSCVPPNGADRNRNNLQERLIVAHKGFHLDGIAPENSLDAIRLANRVGYKAIELDLNITSDGEFVLLHDEYLNESFRTTDYALIADTVYCNKHTLKELNDNYVYKSKDMSMRRPIATLNEALQLCKLYGIYPMLELKPGFKKAEAIEVVNRAERVLGKTKFAITSFDYSLMSYLRSKDKQIDLYCDDVNDQRRLNISNLHYYVHWHSLRNELIDLQHNKGRIAGTWTVEKEYLDVVVDRHVDLIVTDDVAPNFDRARAIYEHYSDKKFIQFTTDGIIADNIVQLNKGQVIELNNIDSIGLVELGAIHFNFEIQGAFEINATNFTTERGRKDRDYITFAFQYMFNNASPTFRIVAMDDNVQIKSIWFAVSKF